MVSFRLARSCHGGPRGKWLPKFCLGPSSYDPYSNVAKKRYPTMLVRTSINDSQVGFWEGSKWVAKLRANKIDKNPLLLKVNMGAGHGGASGRYDALHDLAFDYAFVLTQFGLSG